MGAALVLAVLLPALQAKEPPRVTLNVKDADVRDVLDYLARSANASLIISPNVKGTITFSVRNARWDGVLHAVCATLHLRVVRERSGILRILPGTC